MVKKSKYPTIREVIQRRVDAYRSINMPSLEQYLEEIEIDLDKTRPPLSKNELLFQKYLDEDFVKTSSGIVIRANGKGNKAKFIQHHPLLYKCFDHHYYTKEYTLADQFEDYNVVRERDGAHLKVIFKSSYENIPIPIDYDSLDGIEFSLKSAGRQGGYWYFRFRKANILNSRVWNAFVEGDKNLLRVYRDMVFEFTNNSSISVDIHFRPSRYSDFDTLWPIEIGGIRKHNSDISVG